MFKLNPRSTPKTLSEAIKNAIDDLISSDNDSREFKIQTIEMHARDFLAQKFAAYSISENKEISDAVNTLWREITKEK